MTAVSVTRTSPRSDEVRFESRFFNSMSSAATFNRSHAHKHSSSRSSRPSTTPRAHPNAVSVGQSHPPLLTPRGKSPEAKRDGKSTSPSYFGFVVGGDDAIPPDSNPGHHARQNWSTPQVSLESPRHVPMESNPEFAAFRRQSEKGAFSLNSTFSHMPSRPNASRTKSDFSMSHPQTPLSPGSRPPMDRAQSGDSQKRMSIDQKPIFDMPRQHSPISLSPRHSLTDDKAPRLSLPFNDMHASSLHKVQSRSETLPHSHQSEIPSMVNPKLVAELLHHPNDVLLLDLRVYQQYVTSRIRGSLNLCIPTTLLKRPAFTTQKLAETFSSEPDRQKFETWQKCRYIVAYDACSSQPKEAMIPFNVLKKFSSEGWKGTGYVVKGGYQAFAKMEPKWVDKGVDNSKGTANPALSISPPAKDVLPVAGGCAMPSAKSGANPFFGNIRQNMDLLDGVGQMPVKKPNHMSELSESNLPSWLRRASKSSDEGKRVSEKFLSIEKSEQKRMQDALGGPVCYGPEGPPKDQVQVAGIEKGSKNRYNNIFPFDHTRVRLQGVPRGECDYVNASYVKAQYSNRQYIATQAPIPATFSDFWRVVWEQGVRVIVMLTAESEGGQVKSHPYWKAGECGPFKVKTLSERRVLLEPKDRTPIVDSLKRPSLGQRRSTTNNLNSPVDSKSPTDSDLPSVVVRTFTLSHASYPFQPMREVTQLQYSQWPDFGAPASPTAILGLVEQVNKYVRGSASPRSAHGWEEAAVEGERPIIVHCSAGCGRTGTFCTIDSVIDMLKRQKLDRQKHDEDRMDIDGDSWVRRDDEDLVAKTVDDFRHQRLSMVQNLRQFVLCYESILQWVVSQQPENIRLGKGHEPRRSH